MLSNELVAILGPFAQMTNRNALSAVYRSLRIEPDHIRTSSAYGILEAKVALGLPEPIVIDTASFVAVIKSLPTQEEVILEVKAGALQWECGMATGKLALAARETVISAIGVIPDAPTYKMDKRRRDDFSEALELGGLSCGPVSMASAGIFGVVLDNRENFCVLSSDSVTIARCLLSPAIESFPDQLVLSPEAASLLSAVLDSAGEAEASIIAANTAIYISAGALSLMLRPIPALKHDLRKLAAEFYDCDTLVDLPKERVGAFIKRAAALAENKQNTHVQLSAINGAMSLTFAEGASASEEYYLVDKLEVPDLPPIMLEAGRLARALAHTSYIGLDHIERGVIVLSGKAPPFSYYISGRKDKPA